MRKILLFGSGGFIGTNFRQYFQNNKQYKLITPSAEKNDVLKALDIKKIIQKISPHFIINTAYYGGVSSSIKFSRNNLNKNLVLNKQVDEVLKFYFKDSQVPLFEYCKQTQEIKDQMRKFGLALKVLNSQVYVSLTAAPVMFEGQEDSGWLCRRGQGYGGCGAVSSIG